MTAKNTGVWKLTKHDYLFILQRFIESPLFTKYCVCATHALENKEIESWRALTRYLFSTCEEKEIKQISKNSLLSDNCDNGNAEDGQVVMTTYNRGLNLV